MLGLSGPVSNSEKIKSVHTFQVCMYEFGGWRGGNVEAARTVQLSMDIVHKIFLDTHNTHNTSSYNEGNQIQRMKNSP